MPFNSQKEVQQRLAGNDEPLSLDEIRDLRPWVRHLLQGNTNRIYMELALLNIEAIHLNVEAIKRFDESSSKLSKAMVLLTVGIFFLTAILTYNAFSSS